MPRSWHPHRAHAGSSPNNATDIEWATHPPTIIIHDDVFLFMKARFVGAFVCTPRPSLGGHSRAMAAIAVLWRHVCHMAGPCVCFLAGAWAAGKPTRWTVSPLLGSPVAGPLALRLNGPPYCRKATEPTVLCQPTVGRITPARRPAYASVAKRCGWVGKLVCCQCLEPKWQYGTVVPEAGAGVKATGGPRPPDPARAHLFQDDS